MEKSFVLELSEATKKAALASYPFIGKGDEKGADQAAVSAMRKAFQKIPFQGKVVIGEGERDEAPMLFIGESVGQKKGPFMDLAVDPLEGTTLCAENKKGSLSVLAASDKGNLLHAPDCYMDKLACGPQLKGVLNFEDPLEEKLKKASKALKKPMKDIGVVVLNRKRHEGLIENLRSLGVQVHLIQDGDVSAAIQTCRKDSGVDILLGKGGAPEGVLAAAALKCLGGDFQGRLVLKEEKERKRAKGMGIKDVDAIFRRDEMVKGECIFCATGVTPGPLVGGVQSFSPGILQTQTWVLMSEPQVSYWIRERHDHLL